MTSTQNILNGTATSSTHEEKRSAFNTFLRTITSLSIPMTLALILSLFATFVLRANDGASYFYNAWYLFCKLFFPCTPFMMWFILKK